VEGPEPDREGDHSRTDDPHIVQILQAGEREREVASVLLKSCFSIASVLLKTYY
jgi:hypothetical protein